MWIPMVVLLAVFTCLVLGRNQVHPYTEIVDPVDPASA